MDDWAIERIIAIYNQILPSPNVTIPELVKLFATKCLPLYTIANVRHKTCLTVSDYEYLYSLPRLRYVRVDGFMLTPTWFKENNRKDVNEIARFVLKHSDSDIKKRNVRLYKFATGRNPKADARSSDRMFYVDNF